MSPVDNGIAWPRDAGGQRSTAASGRRIFAAALRELDPAAADAVLAERDWRHAYPQHVRRLVELQARRPGQIVASSHAGLQAAWHELRFVRGGGEQPLLEAMTAPQGAPLASTVVRGQGPDAPARWEVPYRGERLHGDALARQIDRWQRSGVAEPGHCDALRRVLAHPEWLDLSDRRLVLLGAGSEAGPLAWLARWRARLFAVDLARPAPWRRIAGLLRDGNATLVAPRAADAPDELSACGADLLTQTPEIAAWLRAHAAAGPAAAGGLDVGQFAYLDGERHVRVALAMDAIGARLTADDARTTLAFMATPTDLFAVPAGLADEVRGAYARRGLARQVAQAGLRVGARAVGARSFEPHVRELLNADDGSSWGVVDAVVVQQGPNYLLAKRLQQWRAWVARADGQRVSINVAPSTSTGSVVGNRLLAAGFRGARAFDVEVFEPATTNALMAALWVHDLRQPPQADAAANPLAALATGANHGGLWRLPYLPRSVLPLAALLGFIRRH